jgi:hypothetical protein
VIAMTGWFWRSVACTIFVGAVLSLVALDYLSPLDINSPPGMLTWLHLQLLKADPERCYAALDRAKVEYRRTSEPLQNGCGFEFGATLMNSEINHGANLVMNCPALAALLIWEKHVVAQAADRIFRSKVTRIVQAGTYACRNIDRNKEVRRSEHATANAIDVSQFIFANGSRISLEQDWNDKNAKGQFEREVRDGACRIFSVVLSPDYNPQHSNHYHMDLSYLRFCR